MKCVTKYNINSIEHFTFVVNGEFRYGLIKVKINPTIGGMLLITQLRFVSVIKLMKANYKCECPSLFKNFIHVFGFKSFPKLHVYIVYKLCFLCKMIKLLMVYGRTTFE